MPVFRDTEIPSVFDCLTGSHVTRQRHSEFRIPHSEFLRSRTGSV